MIKLKDILNSRGRGSSVSLAEELGKKPQTIRKQVMQGATVDSRGLIRSGVGRSYDIGTMILDESEIKLIKSVDSRIN